MKIKIYLDNNLKVVNTNHDIIAQYSSFDLEVFLKIELNIPFNFSWVTPVGAKRRERNLGRFPSRDEGEWKCYLAQMYPGDTMSGSNTTEVIHALMSVRAGGITSGIIKIPISTSISPQQEDILPTEADELSRRLNQHITDPEAHPDIRGEIQTFYGALVPRGTINQTTEFLRNNLNFLAAEIFIKLDRPPKNGDLLEDLDGTHWYYLSEWRNFAAQEQKLVTISNDGLFSKGDYAEFLLVLDSLNVDGSPV